MSNVKLNAPIINAPTFRLIYCGILKQKLVVLLNSENRQKKRTHCIGMFYVKIFDLRKETEDHRKFLHTLLTTSIRFFKKEI